MTKSAGGDSPAPAVEHRPVGAHLRRQLRIEIDCRLRRRMQLMAGLAILWLRRNTGIGIVTGKADRVAGGNGFERALLQPESITQGLRRLGDVFLAGVALRLISLMTHRTALGRRRLLLLERGSYQPTITIV